MSLYPSVDFFDKSVIVCRTPLGSPRRCGGRMEQHSFCYTILQNIPIDISNCEKLANVVKMLPKLGFKEKRKTQIAVLQQFGTHFKWRHQKMSFISKWLYIFALKNRNKRNLPLLLRLNSAPFCSVSQSRVPTLMQR